MTLDSPTSTTTRRLVLMRHAKSDWGSPSLADHDRPLNKRGRRDGPRMAAWIAENGLRPDLILCSTARRTRETARLLNESWSLQDGDSDASIEMRSSEYPPDEPARPGDGGHSDEVPVAFTNELYHASLDDLLKIIRSDGCDAQTLLVVAHNPGMAQLTSWLAQRSIDMPTAAVAVFEFALADWSRLLSPDQGTLSAFAKPKALPPR